MIRGLSVRGSRGGVASAQIIISNGLTRAVATDCSDTGGGSGGGVAGFSTTFFKARVKGPNCTDVPGAHW